MVGRVHVCISLESCGDLGACAPERMCVSNLSNFCISLKEIIIYCSTSHAVKYCPPAAIPAPPLPPLQLDVGGSGEIMRQRVKV